MSTSPVAMDEPAASASLWSRLFIWCDHHLNPILVKDIRCWLRSRVFLAIFFVGLIAAQLTAVTCIVESARNEDIGLELFVVIIGGMSVLLGGVMPYLVQSRFSDELRNRSTELALISHMTPKTLINGKIQSGLVASFLYFSAVAPTLLIAYLLGGIAAPMAVYAIVALLFLSTASMILALLFVTMRKEKPIRLIGLLCLGSGIGIALLLVAIIETSSRFGAFLDGGFWFVNGVVFILSVLVLHFFYAIAISRLSFDADNRDRYPRFALSLCVFAGYSLIVFLPWIADLMGVSGPPANKFLFTGGLIAALIAFSIGIFFLLDTPDEVSLRVRNQWSRFSVVRMCYDPGLGRLYAYILLHMGIFLVMAITCYSGLNENVFIRPYSYTAYSSRVPYFREMTASMDLVLIAFVGIAFPLFFDAWFRRKAPRLTSEWSRGVVALAVLTAWSAIGLTVAIIFESMHWGREGLLVAPLTALVYLNGSDDRVANIALAMGIPAAVLLFFLRKPFFAAMAENKKFAKERDAVLLAKRAAKKQIASEETQGDADASGMSANPSAPEYMLTDSAGSDDADICTTGTCASEDAGEDVEEEALSS